MSHLRSAVPDSAVRVVTSQRFLGETACFIGSEAIPLPQSTTAETTFQHCNDYPRMPSRRPLDHRWDRSRGILFGRNARSNPSTWSPRHGIIFAEPQYTQRRDYASRPPPPTRTINTTRSTRAPEPPAQTQSGPSEAELRIRQRHSNPLDTRDRVSIQLLLEKDSKIQQMEQNLQAKTKRWESREKQLTDQVANANTKAEAAEESRKNMALEMRETYEQGVRAGKQGAIEDEANLRRKIVDQGVALQQRTRDFAESQSKFKETQRKLHESEGKLKEIQEHSQWQQRQQQLSMELMKEMHAEELQNRREKDQAQRGRDNLVLKEKILSRKEEREDYDGYRGLFDDVRASRSISSGIMLESTARVGTSMRVWRTAVRRFESFCDSTHLPPALRGKIRKFLVKKLQENIELEFSLRQVRQESSQLDDALAGTAHVSRGLTSVLRARSGVESMVTIQKAAGSLQMVFPLLHATDLFEETLKQLRRQITGEGSGVESKGKVSANQHALRAFKLLRSILLRQRRIDLLQQETRQPLEKKAVRVHFTEQLNKTQRLQNDLYVLQSSIPRSPELDKLKRECSEMTRLVRKEMNEADKRIRERVVLLRSLGRTAEFEAEIDGKLQQEIKREQKAMLPVLEEIGVTVDRARLIARGESSRRRKPLAASSGMTRSAAVSPVQASRIRRTWGRRDAKSIHTYAPAGQVHVLPHATEAVIKVPATTPRMTSAGGMSCLTMGSTTPLSVVRLPFLYPSSLPTGQRSLTVMMARHDDVDLPPIGSSEMHSIDSSTITRDPTEAEIGNVLDRSEDELVAWSKENRICGDEITEVNQKVDSADTKDAVSAAEENAQDLPELTYQISAEDYRNAVMASPSTSAAYWTYKLYKNSLGLTPKIHYLVSYEHVEAQLSKFLDEPIIGFDLEWELGSAPGKSNPKRCVSLIQIATEDKIALIHLSMFKGDQVEDLMPPSLRRLLESESVIKAGVNIGGDATRLKNTLGVDMRGLFELSHLYKIVMYSQTAPHKINKKPYNLAQQVHDVLLLPLAKGEVRTSAWSKKLRGLQYEYAASDAYAGFRLYRALEAMRLDMRPTPPRPALYELKMPLILGDGTEAVSSSRSSKRTVTALDEDELVDEEGLDKEVSESEMEDSSDASADDMAEITYPELPSLDAQSEDLPEEELPRDTLSLRESRQEKRVASPQLVQANTWVEQHRSKSPVSAEKQSAGNSALRAYNLWHEQGLDPMTVAEVLREPPLALSTVANYIINAIRSEGLPFDEGRVQEPLGLLPSNVMEKHKADLRRMQRMS